MALRIAQFIDTDIPGGAEVVIVNLSCMLIEKGYEVVVIHFGHPWLEEACERNNITTLIIPGHRYYKSIKLLPVFALKFSNFLKENKIDLLHSHLFGPVTSGAMAAKIAGIRHVGTLHDVYTVKDKSSRIYLVRLAKTLGTKLVAVSQDMKFFYDHLGSFKDDEISVVYNGANCVEHKLRSVNRQGINIPDEDIVYICVGRLVPLKQHEFLFKAFEEFLLRSGKNSRLLIVGDGPEKERLMKYLDDHQLSHVHMLGFQDDVYSLLKLSDCFVLASETEGLSCSIQEAMMASLPVIATDVGGNNELVVDGVNGYLVPNGNVSDLSNALFEIYKDVKLRRQFACSSKNIVEQKFSLASMVEKYEALYHGDLA